MLSIEDSNVNDEGGEWLYVFVCYNIVLEVFNFVVFGLEDVDVVDLVLFLEKCKFLVLFKVGEIEFVDMVGVFGKFFFFLEFGVGFCNYFNDEDSRVYVFILLFL